MDIEGLKKLAEAATPGPWVVYDADGSIGTIEDSAGAALAQAQMRGSLRNPNNIERKANTAFIAAANPQTVLALIAEVEHWKANHADMVARKALLEQRPDLPVDRLSAYREMERLQRELENERIERQTFQHGHRIASDNCVRLERELEEARKDAASQRELRDAVWNLMQMKGRHNTEIAYHRLEAAYLKAVKDAAREKQGEQAKQSEKIVFDNPSYPMWLAQNREKQ